MSFLVNDPSCEFLFEDRLQCSYNMAQTSFVPTNKILLVEDPSAILGIYDLETSIL